MTSNHTKDFQEVDHDIKDLLIRMGNHPGFNKLMASVQSDLINSFISQPFSNETSRLIKAKLDFISEFSYYVSLHVKENDEDNKGE